MRATVESVGYQSFDLFDSMNKDGLKPRIVKVDGGMVANNWFTQFLAKNCVNQLFATIPPSTLTILGFKPSLFIESNKSKL